MTRTPSLEVIVNAGAAQARPPERDPAQWQQSIGIARQACARIFRDGGTPADAIRAFGLVAGTPVSADWSRAVAMIAESLCTPRQRRAA